MEGLRGDDSGGLVRACRRRLVAAFGERAWWVVPLNAGLCGVFALIGWAWKGDPSELFSERQPGTLLSVAMLGLSSIGSLRRALSDLPARVRTGWWIFAASLAMAACDDLLMIHERLDRVINAWLGFDPEGVADNLDGVLVLMYAVPAGLVMCCVWFRYVLSMPAMVWRFGIAGVFFGAMIVLDLLGGFPTIEESAKVLAGTLIFAAVVGAPRAREADAAGPRS